MIRFPFRERKAAQAAAHLLRRHGGEMYYLLLIKLLYLADRKTLISTGRPITGDRLVAMAWGPVLSQVKDLLTMEIEPKDEGKAWRSYISEPSAWKVHAQNPDPDVDELSEYELSVLDEVDQTYGKMDRFELSKWTHGLPEYNDPHGSSSPISPEDILRSAGKSDDEIGRIASDAEETLFMRMLLATP